MFEVHQVKVHIWDPKMFTTLWERGYSWGWYLQYINLNCIHVLTLL